ncbi:translation initiation factor SUI1 [Arcobacteraceae bacterium]|nr:translation initiation factor SUI1 [Arcobacteraceae bacterium]
MFEMGANLDGEVWEKQKIKETKKSHKKSDVHSNTNNAKINKNVHQLVFTFEKRRGKPVTLVGRFYIDEKEKKDLLKLLKSKLGCGGTLKDEWIEIQGDKKEKIIEVLESNGWKFRKK